MENLFYFTYTTENVAFVLNEVSLFYIMKTKMSVRISQLQPYSTKQIPLAQVPSLRVTSRFDT